MTYATAFLYKMLRDNNFVRLCYNDGVRFEKSGIKKKTYRGSCANFSDSAPYADRLILLLSNIKECGSLMREFSSNFKPTFYPSQFFASYAHSQRVHSAATGPLTTALYTTKREG